MPGRPLKICAMPMASETAPPVRAGELLADFGGEHVEVDGVHSQLGENCRVPC